MVRCSNNSDYIFINAHGVRYNKIQIGRKRIQHPLVPATANDFASVVSNSSELSRVGFPIKKVNRKCRNVR